MAAKTSKGQEAYYARYKAQNLQAKNRKRKLERFLAKNPDNEQAREALASVKYRRKKPTNPVWSSSRRRAAQILKEFTGHYNPQIMSSNPKTASEALQTLKSNARPLPKNILDSIQARAMFSLQARLMN